MQYYQLVSARLSEELIIQANLDDCEVLNLLKESIAMMYSMIEFEFDTHLFHNLDHLLNHEFFSTQEMLNGKSLCDLYLNSEAELYK